MSFKVPNALDNLTGTDVTPKLEIHAKEPESLKLGTKLVGQSGTQYQIDQMLQHRTDPILACVYLAAAKDKRKYVLKNIFHTEFEYQLNMQAPLSDCPNLRVVIDTIPEKLLFVYNYSTDHLLNLAKKGNLSDATKKRILRDVLVGLADLHNRISYTVPDNIFVDYDTEPNGAIKVKRDQVGDLEMGSIIPPGLNVRGARLGNPMWRSPEAHAAARINFPSDIFSFGLVRIIFRIDTEGLSEAEKEKLIVRRLLSYFADGPGLVGLLEHLDDSVAQWRDLVLATVPEFTTTDPRKPFSMWEDVDECFRDVMTKMMSLDPARRITAREALEHPWFQNI
ncbi:CMGC protein kinase [Venustampulla echinocandica]|uniref:CMGC protein kinase n=1 Tax=Venustampulla echinocandica TaxID=2656787 RepID=A0A370TDM1_9HELO|nr:CMGC protein kinase [Venustampulla echinocandica]RDL32568.1 CMGC protein kinase [Venustampulla echinocandica]